jgi:hypothetical protein
MLNINKIRKEFEKKLLNRWVYEGLDDPKIANEIWSFIKYSLKEAVKEEQKRIVKELKHGSWIIYLKDNLIDLITRDRDIKIRRQMRKEIIDWIIQKPKEIK